MCSVVQSAPWSPIPPRSAGFVTARDLSTVEACVQAVRRRWREPDHGIWEIRDAPRKHLHSRHVLMAVDKALEVVRLRRRRTPDWVRTPRQDRGRHSDQWLGSRNQQLRVVLWASGRRCGIAGGHHPGPSFPERPRAIGTIRAVEAALRDGPTVYRYRHDDGLPAPRAACISARVGSLRRTSRRACSMRRRTCNAQLLECAGRRDCCPRCTTQEPNTGSENHPQAYSSRADPL